VRDLVLLLLLITGCAASQNPKPRVLVFSKTSGYWRRQSTTGSRALCPPRAARTALKVRFIIEAR
jgi:hypothetical protein